MERKTSKALVSVAILLSLSLTLEACNGGSIQHATVHNEWAWVGGANSGGQLGTYGTPGVAAMGNVPGARQTPVAWTDASGNFWLFGGYGLDSTGSFLFLNDLWKYSSGQWTWMGGSNIGGQKGNYGSVGLPAVGNIPGARRDATSWVDSSGNLWLFGGYGYDSTATFGPLNDLWKYSNGQWTWMGGSNIAGQSGVYGTLGSPSPNNIPGSRIQAVTWVDRSEISGSSADSATTQLAQIYRSMTFGSTAQEHGPGYPVPILPIRAVFTAPWVSRPLATFRVRGIRLRAG